MKKLDFIAQSLIIGLALGFTLYGLVQDGEFYWLVPIYAQLFLGPWQFISSLVNFISTWNQPASIYKNLVNIHLYLSVLYLGVTVGLRVSTGFEPSPAWIMIIPWLLGLYYYAIAYLKMKGHNKYGHRKGHFLPHLRL